MATLIKDFTIDADATQVWDALEDFGALHTRLVPGFVTACTFDGEARTVTFANGSVAKELLVTIDAERRRLVYAIANERIRHYNAVAQVFDDGRGGTRFTWTIDVLPNELAPYISGQRRCSGRWQDRPRDLARGLRGVEHDAVAAVTLGAI